MSDELKNYIKLARGLAIYKQKQSNNYYIYIRGEYKNQKIEKRFSLKTDDVNEAKKQAYAHQFMLEKNMDGSIFSNIKKSNLLRICNDILKKLDKETKESTQKNPQSKTHASCIRNDILPKYGQLSIHQFKSKQIKEILGLATNQTKYNNLAKIIKDIFELAYDEELIKKSDIPEVKAPKKFNESESRSPFSDDHLRLIRSGFSNFINASNSQVTKTNRQLLELAFDFLLEVGCRPGAEIDNLTYGSISKVISEDDIIYRLEFPHTKTDNHRKPRMIQLSTEALKIIIRVHMLFNPDLYPKTEYSKVTCQSLDLSVSKKMSWSDYEDIFFQHLQNDAFIFRRPEKIELKLDWSKFFKQYMTVCKLDYTLYSCRHYFITTQLLNATNHIDLASHCGTSVHMIEKYYSDIKPYEVGKRVLENMPKPKIYLTKIQHGKKPETIVRTLDK
ncbi:hypothetical protein [Vibrio rarus]|uniref:hypothetical protein n=1 Tax=Vibrio rarus TaxID=413403 RepID=UPI0021C29871|nr:hypothetical protein [Vibrio rarus]